MTSLLSTILSCIILLVGISPNGDFHELSEIPQLYQHYSSHAGDQNSMSFAKFFSEHYGQTHDEESEDHHNLPFEHCHHNCSPISYTFIPSSGLNISPLIIPDVVSTTAYTEILPSAPSASIWQPPKI